MIVDTSAWLDYLKATGSTADRRLTLALRRKESMLLPAVVLQEVLQGARSPSHYIQLQTELDRLPVFEPDDVADLHRQAAMLYARCRWQGLTVRSPMDCIIAACALQANMPLLANDRDFLAISSIEPALRMI